MLEINEETSTDDIYFEMRELLERASSQTKFFRAAYLDDGNRFSRRDYQNAIETLDGAIQSIINLSDLHAEKEFIERRKETETHRSEVKGLKEELDAIKIEEEVKKLNKSQKKKFKSLMDFHLKHFNGISFEGAIGFIDLTKQILAAEKANPKQQTAGV